MASVTVQKIRDMKNGAKIVAVTAFDFPTAMWCRLAGVDIVLVGDSFGMVSLGLSDTTEVTVEMMEIATRAVRRGLDSQVSDETTEEVPLLVVDFPLIGFEKPHECAERLRDAGAEAIKIECHEKGLAAIEPLRAGGNEVMAHVGLLPQEVKRLGGYPLQGVLPEEEELILAASRDAESLGAFSCVVEKVPQSLGQKLTELMSIPTIGIGAGVDCDGQILVQYDLLGIFEEFRPKFVRRYAELGSGAIKALRTYSDDVRSGRFPDSSESFT